MRVFLSADTATWHVEIKVGSGAEERAVCIDTMAKSEEEAMRIVRDSKITDLSDLSKISRVSSEMVQHVLGGGVKFVEDAAKNWLKHMKATGRSGRTADHSYGIASRFIKDLLLWSRTVSEVEPSHVNNFVNDRSQRKLGTRRMRLSALRTFFAFCKRNNWTAINPAEFVEVNHKALSHSQKETKHKKVFSEDDINKILASDLDQFERAAIILGRDLALRIGDVCNLEWDSFDLATMRVVVWTEKTKSRVAIPMSSRVLDLFMELPRKDERYVFPEEREIINHPVRRATLSVRFARLFKSLGYSGFSFHSLRATYATTMANSGATINEIAAALGHSSTETTKAYIRKEGAAKL